MSNNFNREESCITGCNIFYETENCQCQNYQSLNISPFLGDEFDMEWCYKGCHYELGWSVGPEFIQFLIILALAVVFFFKRILVLATVYMIYMINA